MSQASRSHAIAATRWRGQVASFIVRHQPGPRFDDWAFSEHFDVHAVRTAAEALLRDYDRPGEFTLAEVVRDDWRAAQARSDGQPAPLPSFPADWMDWRARVRLARRVLAAIEGQPSECGTCGGWGKPSERMHIAKRGPQPEMAELTRPCGNCHGTGHNLRGELPAVEWAPVVRRRRREAHVYAGRGSRCWLDGVPHNSVQGPESTRVVPRGEHRAVAPMVEMLESGHAEALAETATGDLVTWRGELAAAGCVARDDRQDAHVRSRAWFRLPRWRRGELRHAQQRREREMRARAEQVHGIPAEGAARLSNAAFGAIERLAAWVNENSETIASA